MLGGMGNVTLNASDVTIGGWNGVRRTAFEFERSDFNDTVVPLIRNTFFGVERYVEPSRGDGKGRRNLEERRMDRRRTDGMESN